MDRTDTLGAELLLTHDIPRVNNHTFTEALNTQTSSQRRAVINACIHPVLSDAAGLALFGRGGQRCAAMAFSSTPRPEGPSASASRETGK